MKLHYVYPYNMLIANAGVYDAYCEWLFSIMFNLRDSLAASEGSIEIPIKVASMDFYLTAY